MSCTPPADPIQVKASAAPIITSEAFKTIVFAAGGVAVDRLLSSDVSRAAVLPLFGMIAGAMWWAGVGVLHRLHTWRCMKFLANYVSDQVAVVGKSR